MGNSMEENIIQVLAYRKGVDKHTSKPFTYQKHFEHLKITSAVSLFKNLEAVVDAIPEAEHEDVHYTCANCKPVDHEKGVRLRIFAYQEMIPFDLDGIDLTRKNEY